MRKYHHRVSNDIDIFTPDPQYLGFLTPRLSDKAESMTTHYIEQGGSLQLYFDEGEIDFVASSAITQNPVIVETLFGREVQTETPTEIVAKKVWHRGELFTARDIFDLAMVMEKEPNSLFEIQPILKAREEVILGRIDEHSAHMRETFVELEILDYERNFDECVAIVKRNLEPL